MRGVNKVIIVGNLGNDPEVKQFQNGGSVTRIAVATSEQWNDKQTGERREATEWHRISLFNKLGEIAAQYLRKGSQVYIEGSLHTSKYTDQNGIERYSTEIRANQMQMLGSPAGQGNSFNQNTGGYPNQQGGFGGYPNNQPPQHNSGFGAPNPYQNQGNMSGQNGGFNQGNQSNFQSPSTMNNGQNFANNSFMNDTSANFSPNQTANTNNTSHTNAQVGTPSLSSPASMTPKAGAVDDDIPFVYISNQLVGII